MYCFVRAVALRARKVAVDDARLTSSCRSRGIDNDAARQMLVFSFGSEVTQHLKHKRLLERLQAAVNAGLASGFGDASADEA